MVAMNFHCHAPSCIDISFYACPLGTALEDCNAETGKLVCHQTPVYGGTGHPALNGTRFDETGYLAVPESFWGDEARWFSCSPELNGYSYKQ